MLRCTHKIFEDMIRGPVAERTYPDSDGSHSLGALPFLKLDHLAHQSVVQRGFLYFTDSAR